MDQTHFFYWLLSEFIVLFFLGIGVYVRLAIRLKALEIEAESKDKELARVWQNIKDVAAEANRREEKIMLKLEEIAKSITGIQIDAAKNAK
jgi:predicted Holliday junction resolvase-like endonuclease